MPQESLEGLDVESFGDQQRCEVVSQIVDTEAHRQPYDRVAAGTPGGCACLTPGQLFHVGPPRRRQESIWVYPDGSDEG